VNLAMVGHTGFPNIAFPEGLLGVVSFHGGLSNGYAAPQNGTSRPKLLLHSGAKDDTNADISNLTDDLEGVGAIYEIARYGPNVLHSFTEWDSAVPGTAMYDPRADFRSWHDTMDFLKELFSGEDMGTTKPTAAQCNMQPDPNAGANKTSNDSNPDAGGDDTSNGGSDPKGVDASSVTRTSPGFLFTLLAGLGYWTP